MGPVPSSLIGESCFWLGLNVTGLAAGYWLSAKILPSERKSNKHDDADLLGSLPVYPLMLYYGMAHTVSHYHTVQDRWTGTSPASWSFMSLYIARELVSFTAVFLGSARVSSKVLMSLHHITSIIAMGGGIGFARLHWYACLDGCCETTTIFLNLMLLFKEIQYKGVFHTINGVALWSSFLVFRIALFPFWLYSFFSDLSNHPADTAAVTTLFERVFYPATTVMLLGMSSMWFLSITKGALKTLGLISARPGKDSKEH